MHIRTSLPSFTAAMFLPLLVMAETTTAQTVAGRGPILQINAEGRVACRQLTSAGGPYWEGKIQGRTDHDYSHTSNRFIVRNCFKTRSECARFIDRIHHRIMGIEQVYYSRCRSL